MASDEALVVKTARRPRGGRTLLDKLSASWHVLPEASWLGAGAVAVYQALLIVTMPAREPRASTVIAAILAAVAVLALVRRRRWPTLVLAVTLALPWLGQLGHVPASYLFLPGLVAFYTVISLAPPKQQVIGTVAAATSIAGGNLASSHLDDPLASVIPVLTILSTTAAIALAMRSRREGFTHVAEQARAAREEQRLVSQRDTARHRARIIGDLHDSVGHNLTALITLTEGLRGDISDPTVADAIDTINALARESLDETRRAVAELHPENENRGDEPHEEDHIGPAHAMHDWSDLEPLLATARATGLQVTLTETGLRPRDERTGQLLYKIIREALTNTMRHAPSATRVSIMLEHHPDGSELAVTDNASPATIPPVTPPGNGLGLLRDLADDAGGTLAAEPTETGWRLTATLPRRDRS